MFETKLWWQSRTIWANIVAMAFGVGAAFKLIPTGLGQEEVLASIMAMIGVANIVLRFVTTKSIG